MYLEAHNSFISVIHILVVSSLLTVSIMKVPLQNFKMSKHPPTPLLTKNTYPEFRED